MNELCERSEELNLVFTSFTIKQFLMYKFNQVKYIGYIMGFLYFAYLFCVTYYPTFYVMLGWLVYFLAIEIKQITAIARRENFYKLCLLYTSPSPRDRG